MRSPAPLLPRWQRQQVRVRCCTLWISMPAIDRSISDRRYWGAPYHAGAGNGYFWMKTMAGNRYACPLPSCFRGI